MKWKSYAVLARIIPLGVYVFRNNEAIIAEAFPDKFTKKIKKDDVSV
jgi:hypothetical protein